LLAEGGGNKEIASRLHISEHTVKFHVSSILAKLGANTRTDAVARGYRDGLIVI
jgi:DNA-binding NarL/FixJ family response regulator